MSGGVADPGLPAERLCSELRRRGQTLAVVESCTGGGLGAEITRIPGASEVFWGGAVAYSDAAKTALTGVPASLIRECGAVSGEVAISLAEGIRARAACDWGAAITGIAGPAGGSPAKPVGTIWLAVAGPSGLLSRRLAEKGSRDEVRAAAIAGALNLLIEAMNQDGD